MQRLLYLGVASLGAFGLCWLVLQHPGDPVSAEGPNGVSTGPLEEALPFPDRIPGGNRDAVSGSPESPSGGATVDLAAETADLVVRVVDSFGSPRPGVDLTLEAEGYVDLELLSEELGLATPRSTDSEGESSWWKLPIGSSYRLRVQSTMPATMDPPHEWKPSYDARGAIRTGNLAPSNLSGRIVLDPGMARTLTVVVPDPSVIRGRLPVSSLTERAFVSIHTITRLEPDLVDQTQGFQSLRVEKIVSLTPQGLFEITDVTPGQKSLRTVTMSSDGRCEIGNYILAVEPGDDLDLGLLQPLIDWPLELRIDGAGASEQQRAEHYWVSVGIQPDSERDDERLGVLLPLQADRDYAIYGLQQGEAHLQLLGPVQTDGRRKAEELIAQGELVPVRLPAALPTTLRFRLPDDEEG